MPRVANFIDKIRMILGGFRGHIIKDTWVRKGFVAGVVHTVLTAHAAPGTLCSWADGDRSYLNFNCFTKKIQ